MNAAARAEAFFHFRPKNMAVRAVSYQKQNNLNPRPFIGQILCKNKTKQLQMPPVQSFAADVLLFRENIVSVSFLSPIQLPVISYAILCYRRSFFVISPFICSSYLNLWRM